MNDIANCCDDCLRISGRTDLERRALTRQRNVHRGIDIPPQIVILRIADDSDYFITGILRAFRIAAVLGAEALPNGFDPREELLSEKSVHDCGQRRFRYRRRCRLGRPRIHLCALGGVERRCGIEVTLDEVAPGNEWDFESAEEFRAYWHNVRFNFHLFRSSRRKVAKTGAAPAAREQSRFRITYGHDAGQPGDALLQLTIQFVGLKRLVATKRRVEFERQKIARVKTRIDVLEV